MDASVGTHNPSSTLATAARRRRLLRVLQAAAISIILYFIYLNVKPRASNHCLHSTTSLASLSSYYTIPSGDRIPSLALGKSSKCYTSHVSYPKPTGVWKADKNEVGQAVKTALKAGYRHIDDAWAYQEVGAAIRASGIPRKDIWITTKLWNTEHNPGDVRPALEDSLRKLGVDYLDLYLMHRPIAFKKETKADGSPIVDFELTENPYLTWKAMEELVDTGKVRNIGISNFNLRRIKNLTANPLKYRPAVNQIELNYLNPQPELLKWAEENDLLLEAYSPLGGSEHVKEMLNVPEIKKATDELGRTPAQVAISWHIQRGTVVLPKSVTPSRVIENCAVAKLPTRHFVAIEAATQTHTPERAVNPDWGVDIFEDEA